jgi:LacI family transcriptional regulator
MSRLLRLPQILLLIETSEAYGRGLVKGIVRYTEEHRPWSISFEPRALIDPLPRSLKHWRGDGIISRVVRKADLATLMATGASVVELNLAPERVRPDEDAVARLAVEHFLERGFHDFAFFSTCHEHWIDRRWHAFELAVKQHGYLCHSFDCAALKRPSDKNLQPIDERSVIRWLCKLPKPCGVFCVNDLYTMRLAAACRTAGIIVPDQIALLGVDNDPVFCGACSPRLSSIDLNSERIGYEAAALLARMMAGEIASPESVCLEPRQLVTRESTDILAIDDAEMAQAVRLIHSHAGQPLQVGQLAEMLGFSRRSFEHHFWRALHRTPKEEILRVQMERVKRFLTTSTIPISQVAKKCGFASLQYFARAFRRQTGMTPLAYRKKHYAPVGEDDRQ